MLRIWQRYPESSTRHNAGRDAEEFDRHVEPGQLQQHSDDVSRVGRLFPVTARPSVKLTQSEKQTGLCPVANLSNDLLDLVRAGVGRRANGQISHCDCIGHATSIRTSHVRCNRKRTRRQRRTRCGHRAARPSNLRTRCGHEKGAAFLPPGLRLITYCNKL